MSNAPGKQAGRVIVHHGRRCLVETADGQRLECTLPRKLKPVCGDEVVFQAESDERGHLVEIGARRNAFPRVDRKGRPRIIAANLDRVLVVLAPEPPPTRYVIDRYLVAAHTVGIEPVLVANKADLPEHAALMERLAPYESLGYRVATTCATSAGGVDDLLESLRDVTSVLAGQSGVGKSRLAEAVLPNERIDTQAISHSTGKGRHTTTTATLYHLPGGGELIDSPGVWEYGLWRMPDADVARGFIELRPHLDRCKFRDCRHDGEPGCAVAEAAENGEITEKRLKAYRQILKEMKEER